MHGRKLFASCCSTVTLPGHTTSLWHQPHHLSPNDPDRSCCTPACAVFSPALLGPCLVCSCLCGAIAVCFTLQDTAEKDAAADAKDVSGGEEGSLSDAHSTPDQKTHSSQQHALCTTADTLPYAQTGTYG